MAFCWEDQLGRKHQGAAQLANISPSGASVEVQSPVRIGTKLLLDYQNQELCGKVKYCVLQRSGYRLGIEFQDGNRWSPRRS